MTRWLASLAVLGLAAHGSALAADPDDYVATPGVESGEREIELRAGSATPTGDGRRSAASLAFGYGVTPWWFTEVYGKWNRGDATRFDAFEWENRFQLTEPGEYFADFGLLVELERPRDRAEGYELRLGPLMQEDFGPVQANVNVLIARHYRAAGPVTTELGYQWQLSIDGGRRSSSAPKGSATSAHGTTGHPRTSSSTSSARRSSANSRREAGTR